MNYSEMSESQLQEYAKAQDASLEFFQEKMHDLELAMEDQGWQRLSAESEKEFSVEGQKTINTLSRYMFLKNPLIRRAVLTQSNYVFGKGVDFKTDEPDSKEQETLDSFLDDVNNMREITSHQSMMMKENELQLFGNVMFVLITDRFSKRVTVRTIPIDEITDIIPDPDDVKRPLFYKRERTARKMDFNKGEYVDKHEVTYFKDYAAEHDRKYKKIKQIGGNEVRQDAVIYHVTANRLSDMKFGVSEVYSALDWSRAYKEFLENWATIVKAHSKYAWKMVTKGGKQGVQNAQRALDASSGSAPPLTASSFVSNQGTTMEPMRTAGATTSASDGQHMVHMVSAATGIFYHYLVGDPSTGNLATAKSMERPMELQFRNRQELWNHVYTDILEYAIKKKHPETSINVEVKFPSLLEHSTQDMINAIVSAATLNGSRAANSIPMRTITDLLLRELDVEGIEEKLDEWFPEGDQWQETNTFNNINNNVNVDDDNNNDVYNSADDLVKESLNELKEAVRILNEQRPTG